MRNKQAVRIIPVYVKSRRRPKIQFVSLLGSRWRSDRYQRPKPTRIQYVYLFCVVLGVRNTLCPLSVCQDAKDLMDSFRIVVLEGEHKLVGAD